MQKRLIVSFLVLAFHCSNAYGALEVSWIDLPENNLKEVLNGYDDLLTLINNLIQDYHKIPKEDFHNISQRIKLLKRISKAFKAVQANSRDKYIINLAQTLSTVSLKKRPIYNKSSS